MNNNWKASLNATSFLSPSLAWANLVVVITPSRIIVFLIGLYIKSARPVKDGLVDLFLLVKLLNVWFCLMLFSSKTLLALFFSLNSFSILSLVVFCLYLIIPVKANALAIVAMANLPIVKPLYNCAFVNFFNTEFLSFKDFKISFCGSNELFLLELTIFVIFSSLSLLFLANSLGSKFGSSLNIG